MRELKPKKRQQRGKDVWVVDEPSSRHGKRKRKFFTSEAEADKHCATVNKDVDRYGAELASIPIEDRMFISRWRERLSLEEMQMALERFEAQKTPGVSCREAVESYLKRRHEDGLKKTTLAALRYQLGNLAENLGKEDLADLTPARLDAWLRKGKLSEATRRNRLRVLRQFFRHAERMDWIEMDPTRKVEVIRPKQGEVKILAPDEMEDALEAAADSRLLRYLVLGGFGGLRHVEILALTVDRIHWEEGEIHVLQSKTERKGFRDRYVTMQPALKAWLKRAGLPETGRVIELNDKNLRVRRDALKRRLGWEVWPSNALRHSFGSYHLAAFEDAGQTAAQMGHTDPQTTFQHYRKLVRKKEGEAWFALRPKAG